jgi:hypothetical protein
MRRPAPVTRAGARAAVVTRSVQTAELEDVQGADDDDEDGDGGDGDHEKAPITRPD